MFEIPKTYEAIAAENERLAQMVADLRAANASLVVLVAQLQEQFQVCPEEKRETNAHQAPIHGPR